MVELLSEGVEEGVEEEVNELRKIKRIQPRPQFLIARPGCRSESREGGLRRRGRGRGRGGRGRRRGVLIEEIRNGSECELRPTAASFAEAASGSEGVFDGLAEEEEEVWGRGRRGEGIVLGVVEERVPGWAEVPEPGFCPLVHAGGGDEGEEDEELGGEMDGGGGEGIERGDIGREGRGGEGRGGRRRGRGGGNEFVDGGEEGEEARDARADDAACDAQGGELAFWEFWGAQ